MRKSPKSSPEAIERAVRMVFDTKDRPLCSLRTPQPAPGRQVWLGRGES